MKTSEKGAEIGWMGKVGGDPEGPKRLAGVGAEARRCQGAGGEGKTEAKVLEAN